MAVDGVHLSLDGVPFRVRGVTYGSFLPRRDGSPFPETDRCRADFRAMARLGLNVVRTYELPPPDVMAAAAEHGLRMMVGLHYADWRMMPEPGRHGHRDVRDAGLRAVDQALEACAGRPEVLAIAVGNEVPGDLVRWWGPGRVEAVLGELVAAVHAGDPAMPVTYVNYPTTEYLEVPGQDLVCFNVFLEDPAAWRRYLRHLQVVAGERPVVITECGLASEVHGEAGQADALRWLLRTADETGIGTTVFSWTDDWGVAGEAVGGWGFGITRTDRTPKEAATEVGAWAGRPLRALRAEWPPVSVVVCAHNEERRIGACLESLSRSDYPALEVIVCDDGSRDNTREVASRSAFRVLALPHGGLSRARNAGLAAATSDIIAYLDADAQCHPDWPYHLALAFEDPSVAAAGGPNLPVPGAGFQERVVAACPGGPTHVLLTDDRAEHIPGCNMAIRRQALAEAGGFDEVYTSAGDDVDVCWRLLDRGGAIAFVPAAQVYHHRRDSLRGYLRQQFNYGRSECMVASRHPHQYNRLGQARWRGFIYGGQRLLPSLLRPVIYHGVAGTAPFQRTELRTAEVALGWALALLPLLAVPFVLGLAMAVWRLSWLLLPGAVLAVLAGHGVLVALSVRPPAGEPRPVAFRLMVGAMHVLQPMVRAWGRIRGTRLAPVAPRTFAPWRGDRTQWVHEIVKSLASRGFVVRYGAPGDAYDLEVSRHGLAAARVTLAVAWSWIPIQKVRLRVTSVPVMAFLAGLTLAALDYRIGLPVALVAGLGTLWEVRRLHRATLDALAETTVGAVTR